jgi:hypothetical protein
MEGVVTTRKGGPRFDLIDVVEGALVTWERELAATKIPRRFVEEAREFRRGETLTALAKRYRINRASAYSCIARAKGNQGAEIR